MKEEVELIDGSKVEITCRYLIPRKAFNIVRKLFKVTEMKEAKEGEGQTLVGDFSGVFELIPVCIDEIVQDCPQKDKISIKSMRSLYEKYAEKTIGEVMASVTPLSEKK